MLAAIITSVSAGVLTAAEYAALIGTKNKIEEMQ